MSGNALAQSRPECIADLMKPGACFYDAVVGEVFIGCNPPGESDVVEGILVWEDVGTGVNGFNRINPDGTLFAHNSSKDMETIFCPWDTVFVKQQSGASLRDCARRIVRHPSGSTTGRPTSRHDGLFVGPRTPVARSC